MVTFEAKDVTTLPEGNYTGAISRIEERTPKGFHYIDFYILEDKSKKEMKFGFNANLSTASALGKFVSKFISFKGGDKVDVDELIGKKVVFKIENEDVVMQDGRVATFNRVTNVKPQKE